MESSPKKLLDQVRDTICIKHYSYRTEKTYIERIKRFILFHGKRNSKDMGAPEIQANITYLAVEHQVSASTQNQALSAILFLYRFVIQKDVDLPVDLIRAGRQGRDSLLTGRPGIGTHLEPAWEQEARE